MNNEVLRERARALSRRAEKTRDAQGESYLSFLLGEERYALPLSQLSGVLKFEKLTPVPGSDSALLGLVNHRGYALPIYRLAELLGLESGQMSYPTVALLAERGSGRAAASSAEDRIGLKVDETEGLITVAVEEITPSSGEYSRGRTENGIVLLDLQHLWKHPLFQESQA